MDNALDVFRDELFDIIQAYSIKYHITGEEVAAALVQLSATAICSLDGNPKENITWACTVLLNTVSKLHPKAMIETSIYLKAN